MSKKSRFHQFRALLTDTLPYEIPIIFSNERLYRSLVRGKQDSKLGAIAIRRLKSYTEPYSYRIRKERGSWNTLSIVHPLAQIEMALFYDSYAQTILNECGRSPASLRKPVKVTPVYTPENLKEDGQDRDGLAHPEAVEGEFDLPRIANYFTYRRYNLLARFFETDEFVYLEKRFSRFRSLDVRKCFFNIYTHSITWAVKGKDYAKNFRNLASFEGDFDLLMQRLNYNETNGIVVGPEMSRIFAEVIFQEIDNHLIDQLKDEGLHWGRQYEFRRYVDDYLVFSDSDSYIDVFQSHLERVLERYKLYLNDSKSESLARPFVTDLSVVKRNVRNTLSSLSDLAEELVATQAPEAYRRLCESLEERTRDLRIIVRGEGVGFHNISGWALAYLKGLTRRIFSHLPSAAVPERENAFERAAASLLSLIFYICSLDLRVRTTYNLAQTLLVLKKPELASHQASSDWLQHFVQEEIVELAILACHKALSDTDERDSIELYNVLICGAYLFEREFVLNTRLSPLLHDLLDAPISYFHFISMKFVFLRAASESSHELSVLNRKAEALIRGGSKNLFDKTETYLIFCDFMSSPDIDSGVKLDLWKHCFGGSPSKADVVAFGESFSFTDWEGLQLENTLKRKSLRPAYE